MKKRLAIFGDSFAELCDPKVYASQGWAGQLADLYGPDQVDNFARHSTSLQWSMHNFVNNYQNYEQLIFVVTSSGRLDLPINYTAKFDPCRVRTEQHWAGINNFEYFQQQLLRAEDPHVMKFIRNYFVYMTRRAPGWRYEKNYYEITLSRIRELAPQAIIIPGFEFAKPYTPEYTWCLIDISLKEYANSLNRDSSGDRPLFFRDLRPNHFTRASNQFVLAHVRARLEQNQFINWVPEQTPTYTRQEELFGNS
jgi:hypothetical protein